MLRMNKRKQLQPIRALGTAIKRARIEKERNLDNNNIHASSVQTTYVLLNTNTMYRCIS